MLNKVLQLCEDNGVKLLYLTKFGSHLYGTDTPESDSDYKGIFLPSRKQCFLQDRTKSINYSSGKNDSKNNEDDVDIQLWSLQYFLKLVSTGETNALDLLYSFTHPEMVIFKHAIMDRIFDNHSNLYNIKDCKAFVGYAIGQAKKYGIKGSRLGVLKNVCSYFQMFQGFEDEELSLWISDKRLSYYLTDIIERYYDPSFCFLKDINGIESLVLCGKVHQSTITVKEFYSRIKKQYDQYGKRAELAEQNQGIDWKALSHAVRALTQMRQLIHTRMIQFPLHNADYLMYIKQGKLGFKEVEKLIYSGIEDISLLLACDVPTNKRDIGLIESIILEAYK